jgi:hypothetical protein
VGLYVWLAVYVVVDGMIHYHCADINPHNQLLDLAGRHLLVSFAYPRSVRLSHEIAQSVLLDNGAFSAWVSGKATDWTGFYDWADEWLDCPTTWAIIPDVIDGPSSEQDALIRQWPHGERGAPVWHLADPIERLLLLTDKWPRVCAGSSGIYKAIGDDKWHRRMVEAFNALSKRHKRLPWIHGLRMQGVGHLYPFASVDSADIARNNNRPQNTIIGMADRWDKSQPNFRWSIQPEQQELIA